MYICAARAGFSEIHNNFVCLEAEIIFDGKANSRLFPF